MPKKKATKQPQQPVQEVVQSFVYAFVNPKSGNNLGTQIMKVLGRELGKDAVCNLAEVSPESFLETKVLPNQRKARLLVCGGDGTAGWILGALAKLRMNRRLQFQPPLAVVPLGTGNDLARSLGWGPGIKTADEIPSRLEMIRRADVTILDQWDLVRFIGIH